MRVFLTGATGLIGSAIIPELINAGHHVVALTRSEVGAAFLRSAKAEPRHGDLKDLKSLYTGASEADAVIHCAFDHDFSKFKENSETDKLAIETFGAALAGSDRPFLVSTGIPLESPIRPMTEDTEAPQQTVTPRVSEQCALLLLSQGVNVGIVRLPQVHDTSKQGLVSSLIAIARQKGVSAYVGDGQNSWSAAHVLDVAQLYRLALEKHQPGVRYHAVTEQKVSLRDIAESIGNSLKIPTISIAHGKAEEHFGFFGKLVTRDLTASNALTRQRLDWNPTGPTLVEDIGNLHSTM